MPLKNFKNVGELQGYEYLLGQITSINTDEDTCGLTIGDSTFDAVPIFFHCDPDVEEQSNGSLKGAAGAFEESDNVIVLAERVKESGKLFVIANITIKRHCEKTIEITIIVTDCSTGIFLMGVLANATIRIGENTQTLSGTTDARGIVIFTVNLPKGEEDTATNWSVALSKDGYDSSNVYFTTTEDYTKTACLIKTEDEEEDEEDEEDDYWCPDASFQVLSLASIVNGVFFELESDYRDACKVTYPAPYYVNKWDSNYTTSYYNMQNCISSTGFGLRYGSIALESPQFLLWGLTWWDKTMWEAYPEMYFFTGGHEISFTLFESGERNISMDLRFSGCQYPDRVLTDTYRDNWLGDPPAGSFEYFNPDNISYPEKIRTTFTNYSLESLSNVMSVMSYSVGKTWRYEVYTKIETETSNTIKFSYPINEWTGEDPSQVLRTEIQTVTGTIITIQRWIDWNNITCAEHILNSNGYSSSKVYEYYYDDHDTLRSRKISSTTERLQAFYPDTEYLYCDGSNVGIYGYEDATGEYLFLPLTAAEPGTPFGCLGGWDGMYANEGIFEDVEYSS